MAVTIVTENLRPHARYPLYKTYAGEDTAQDAWLEVDVENKEIYVNYRHGHGEKSYSYGKLNFTYWIPNRITRKGIDKLLEEAKPIVEDMVDRYDRGDYDTTDLREDLNRICWDMFSHYDNVSFIGKKERRNEHGYLETVN